MMRLAARPVVALRRGKKARMIEAFLTDALGGKPEGLDILDIGCGNGDMMAYFAIDNRCVGLDIQDQCRAEFRHLPRCISRSEAMPFNDAVFDVVISHHVIEHVESHDGHLSEIRRVLKSDGIAYLGTPNLASPFMRGHVGNHMVLRYREMRPLFERNGFSVEECYTRWLSQPDRYHCETRLGRWVPSGLLHAMRNWYPSQCFLLRPSTATLS